MGGGTTGQVKGDHSGWEYMKKEAIRCRLTVTPASYLYTFHVFKIRMYDGQFGPVTVIVSCSLKVPLAKAFVVNFSGGLAHCEEYGARRFSETLSSAPGKKWPTPWRIVGCYLI